ncbi:MFS transporter [Parapedobacter indicus]|uniref:Predicted arabinose efflux permease, MFS family n=1 Tax=Parapedobacter indicus TaxID=1477437 RepID=A0A1I3IFG1_9SPHI|nr:MFS transporter [Parapedobacter indicus]PPL02144.1 putative MFS family arabinose efflux permease [Parapedobacter indicus]SFI46661.1 Predicted arabinose efflux permease, MFS family [Parapedobacter indicus]
MGRLIYVSFLACVAALGGFLFGFDTAVISGALSPLIRYFDLASQPALQGWLVSSVVLGSVVGALLSGYLSDRLGRKPTLVWVGILFLISSIGAAASGTFFLFVCFRLMAGIAVGIAAMVSPLYIAEVAPMEIRGRMVALNQFALTIGILIAYLSNHYIGNLLSSQANAAGSLFAGVEIWRIMLGTAAVPSLLFLLLLVFVPESPRFRMLADEARSVTSFADLVKTPMRRTTLIVLYLAIVSQLSGIDLVLHYGPLILERAGFSFVDSLGGQLVFGVVLVLFTLLAMWKVDTLGRRPLLFIGNAGICCTLFLIGYFFTDAAFSETGLLIAISCFVACFAFSMGPIPWIVMAEMFPTKVRGQAMALATFSLFGANWIIAQLFPISMEHLGESLTFWLLALITLPTFFFVWKYLPETKGKALEEEPTNHP